MKKRIFISFLLCLLLISSTVSFAQEKTILRVAAGGLQGAWFLTAAGLAEIIAEADPTIQLDVVPGAGLSNPARVGSGEIEMSMSFPPFTNSALNGVLPFEEAFPDIRGVIKGFGSSVLHFAVIADTGLETIDELVEKKVPINLVVERKGTVDEYSCSKVLESYGIDYSTIESWGGSVKFVGYGDQVTMIKDGHANAVFQIIAVPSPTLIEMGTSRQIKILKFSDNTLKFMNEKYSYAFDKIPAGTYGVVEKDYDAPACINSWIIHKDIPEDVVYRIVKILCENVDKIRQIHASTANFDLAGAALDLGAPLHPGAERYYREAGLIK